MSQHLFFAGCGSTIGTQNGTLVNGNMDQNLWSPGGLILTHTHLVVIAKWFFFAALRAKAMFGNCLSEALPNYPPSH